MRAEGSAGVNGYGPTDTTAAPRYLQCREKKQKPQKRLNVATHVQRDRTPDAHRDLLQTCPSSREVCAVLS